MFGVPVFENEIELAQSLKDMLLPKFKEVYANVNLASRKFYELPAFHGLEDVMIFK